MSTKTSAICNGLAAICITNFDWGFRLTNWGRGNRMESAMVTLDRTLLSLYGLSTARILRSVTVWL